MEAYVTEDQAKTLKQIRQERERKKIETRRRIEELREEKEFNRHYNYED